MTPDVSVPSAFTTNLAAGRPPPEPGVRRATAAGPAPRARAADTRPSAVAASQPGHTRDVHTRSRSRPGGSHPGYSHLGNAHTQGDHTWGTLTPGVRTPGAHSHPGHPHTQGTLTPGAHSHPGRSHPGHTHAHGMVTPMARSHPEEQLRAPAQWLTSVRPPLSSSHQATRKLSLTSHPHFAVPGFVTSSQEGACTHTCCTCRRRGSVSAAPDSKVNGCSCPGRV